MVGLLHERAHAALVVLKRTVNIKVFQADDLVHDAAAQRPQVEHVLGVAVHVERFKGWRDRIFITVTLPAVAVGGRAGGIDEARAAGQRPFAQAARGAVVILQQEVGIALGGGATCAQVDAGACLRGAPLGHHLHEVSRLDNILVKEAAQVLPLFIRAERVHQ